MFKNVFLSLSLMTLLTAPALSAAPAPTKPAATDSPKSPIPSSSQLKPRMRDAFQAQIAKEQYSSNLYLTYASYFADLGLDGCEQFFRAAYADEAGHALLFFNQLTDRNERIQLLTVPASAPFPTSILDAFQKLYENEKQVTASIHNLYTIALEEKDYASQAFLHAFLLMQVEEEKQAQDLMQLLEMGPNDPAFILQFDTRLLEKQED